MHSNKVFLIPFKTVDAYTNVSTVFIMRKFDINVVGASGLVGRTFLKILEEENFPVNNLNLFSGEAGNGKNIYFKKIKYTLRIAKELPKSDFTLLATEPNVSMQYIKTATLGSVCTIDNSSACRLKKDVPLIVPEINFRDCLDCRLIANPNCSTAICAIPLWILDKKYGIKRVRICSYQSVSGSGKKGLESLKRDNGFYRYDIRKTCIPKIGNFNPDDYTTEEVKLKNELRKILNRKMLPISATCVRVPIRKCHALVVSAVLNKNFSITEVKHIFSMNKALTVYDEPENDIFPVSTIGSNNNSVFIGRIRKDSAENNSILFYALSDNLRRGAAYNAYKIIESLTKII